MLDQSEFLDASGDLDHGAIRAYFLCRGKLPGLSKGESVYVDSGSRWELVRLVRRLPGDVWIAKYLQRPEGAPKTIVMASNYGGKYWS